jgi:hypothetical protein
MTKNQKPYFPFDKIPFQEKGESDEQLRSYDLEAPKN